MSLPQAFLKRLEQNFPDHFNQVMDGLNDTPTVSIRCNNRKSEIAFDNGQVPWCSEGFYLEQRPFFTMDPCFHAGAYYVQEASSMFISHVLKTLNIKEQENLFVLDLCAAPGGKSTLMLDQLSESATLVSNEIIPKRNQVLQENITKSGYANVLVTQARAEDFAHCSELFDLILVDAPCSGEGMFRKDETAIEEWSEGLVQMCAERQENILEQIWQCLNPGGYIIYSTCTFEPAENEKQVALLSKNHGAIGLDIPVEENWNIAEVRKDTITGYYFLPGFVKGEGFFCSVVQKPGEKIAKELISKTSLKKAKTDKFLIPENNLLVEWKNEIHLLPYTANTLLEILITKKIQITAFGNIVLESDRAGEKLHPYAPWSNSFDLSSLPFLEADHKTAIRYLKRESISGNFSQLPKGLVLIKYRDFNLGLANNLLTRLNNLYPKEWRILTSKYEVFENIVNYGK